jgi:hypothetical protein
MRGQKISGWLAYVHQTLHWEDDFEEIDLMVIAEREDDK